jgi:arylsulfatase A-like enzyme
MAEVYAGFLSYTDHQIGRIIDYLEQSGQLDNTLVIVISDNGASGEGGPTGSVNEGKAANGVPDSLEENLKYLDVLGSPRTYNHYPTGWAMAFNTPFKMWKRYSYNGGICDPFLIHWPAGITSRGQVRHQYHHAIDIVPTILDVVGVEAPEVVKGYTQQPIEGVSMRYSFEDAQASSARQTQFYSAPGLESRHDAPVALRLGPLRQGHLGALPHRRGPLREPQSRRAVPGQAPGADRAVVLRSGQIPGLSPG